MIRLRTPILAVALLIGATLLAPRPASAAGPTVAPVTPSVGAGLGIRFTGSGFAPDERLSVWATAPNQAVLGGPSAFSGEDGSAEVSFVVPSDAVGGTWSITVYGALSQTPAIAQFTVVGRPVESAALLAVADPPAGPPGTTFRFIAAGFKEQERYSYWFTGPDNQVYDPHSQEDRTNKNGRATITWRPPAGAPAGAWVVTIQGIKSGVARGIPFQIQ